MCTRAYSRTHTPAKYTSFDSQAVLTHAHCDTLQYLSRPTGFFYYESMNMCNLREHCKRCNTIPAVHVQYANTIRMTKFASPALYAVPRFRVKRKLYFSLKLLNISGHKISHSSYFTHLIYKIYHSKGIPAPHP